LTKQEPINPVPPVTATFIIDEEFRSLGVVEARDFIFLSESTRSAQAAPRGVQECKIEKFLLFSASLCSLSSLFDF
jgi:hypothetical protein